MTTFPAAMIKLALRNILRQKVRTAMILAAIIFGVVGLIVSGGFVQDMFAQLAETIVHSQTGHIQIALRGYFGAGTRSPDKYLLRDIDGVTATIKKQPEVEYVMARIGFSGLLNNGSTDLSIVGEGIEPAKEAALGTFIHILQGRMLRQEDLNGVLLGEGVAKSLRLKPGDPASILVATTDGAMNLLDFLVVGVFQSFSRDYDDRTVKIPMPAAQELLGTSGANVVVVVLGRTEDTGKVAARLASELKGAGIEIKSWQEINDFYPKTVELYSRQFGVLRLVVLMMVLLSVLNAVNMSILERAGEFGTMRALGNRNRAVFKFVIVEGVVLGVAGSVIGTLLGLGLALVISAVGVPMPPPPNSNIGYTAHIRIEPAVVIGAFLVGVFATAIASSFPAHRVSRLPIAEALRRVV